MSWFSKKKNDDYDIIEQEESLYVPFGQQSGPQPSHVLTVGEVRKSSTDIQMESSESSLSPLEALRSRVMKQVEEEKERERLEAEKAEKQQKALEEQRRLEEEKLARELEQKRQEELALKMAAEKAAEEAARKAAEERISNADLSKEKENEKITVVEEQIITFDEDIIEEATVEDASFSDTTVIAEEPATKEVKTNLLEKCTPFILDDEGNSAVDEEPAYTLESVASILGTEEKVFESTEEAEPKKPQITSETIVMERSAFKAAGVLSDIDEGGNEGTVNPVDLSATTMFTKRFDPVVNGAVRNTMTFTRIPDLNTGIAEATRKQEAEEKLIEDIFGKENEESFEPKDEYLCASDAKRIGKKLKIAKRNGFYSVCISLFCFALSCIFSIPSIVTALSGAPLVHGIIQCCISGIAILSNLRVWKGPVTLFKNYTSTDCAVAFCEMLFAINVGLNFKSVTDVCYMSMLMTFILFTASACNFNKTSYTLSNFRFVANARKKNVLTLIDDRPTTLSMADDSIEGDILVAASRRVTNVTDFMKNATAPMEFEGKFKIILFVFLIIAVLSGLAGGFTRSVPTGVNYTFGVFALLCAPTLIMCDVMPLTFAAKRLRRKGAMISGKAALNKLEMANACVMKSSDFFPRGTVTLHNLQVLSDNNVDRTLLEAASVASALKSPVADILCDIACGTLDTSTLPKCDSVRYENKMGISGWVGNNRIFIGNYDLLKAHGINPPDFETVKKIMRNGYFPVFIASNQKACAILTVKYSVNPLVSKELSRICNMGITLLVNNCDPNLSEEMLCDYFGLFPDSVHIMSDAGIHMYKNKINYLESSNAPAVHSDQSAVVPVILSTAIRTKKAISVLRFIHILTAAIGTLTIVFLSFNRSDIIINGLHIMIYEMIISLFSYLIGLFYKLK